MRKLSPENWERVASTFIALFKRTTAHQLFDEKMRIPEPPTAHSSSNGEDSLSASKTGFIPPLPLSPGLAEDNESKQLGIEQTMAPPRQDRKQVFRQIIVKCVLQLLLIETAHELLQNEEVYLTIPPAELLRLMGVLDDSYRFAKRFNADKDLRTGLWKVGALSCCPWYERSRRQQTGFMKQLPNLLKQESSSSAVLVNVLLRMYSDHRPDHLAKRGETVEAFVPCVLAIPHFAPTDLINCYRLGVDILAGYVSLEPETQARNIAAWTPVVAEVLQGFAGFADVTVRFCGLSLSPPRCKHLHSSRIMSSCSTLSASTCSNATCQPRSAKACAVSSSALASSEACSSNLMTIWRTTASSRKMRPRRKRRRLVFDLRSVGLFVLWSLSRRVTQLEDHGAVRVS